MDRSLVPRTKSVRFESKFILADHRREWETAPKRGLRGQFFSDIIRGESRIPALVRAEFFVEHR